MVWHIDIYKKFPNVIGAILLLAVCSAAAEEGAAIQDKAIFFDASGGVRCRLTAEGGGVWRLLAASDGGKLTERGAAQALADYMGERIPYAAQTTRRERKDGCDAFVASDGSSAVLRTSPFGVSFVSPSGRAVVEIDRVETGRATSALGGRLLRREAVYGLGERFDGLNKRGRRVVLYSRDGWNDSSSTYMPIPLFSTTRGGGVFMNMYERMVADFGATDSGRWRIETERGTLDAYVFATDRIRDVPGKYIALTGRPVAPQEWMTGPVVCRTSPDLSVLEGTVVRSRRGRNVKGFGVKDIVRRHIEMGAKPSAVILEPWPVSGVFRGPPESRAAGKSELKAATGWLSGLGIKSLVWMRCGSAISTEASGFRQEFLAHAAIEDEYGNALTQDTARIPNVNLKDADNPDVGGKGVTMILDITNPEAWDWYMDAIWKPLADCGISGAKIDFCELLPDDGRLYGKRRVRYKWRNPEAFRGAAVHHAYPAFFIARLCRDMDAILSGRGGFMGFSRGGGIGVQRSAFMWAGDQTRRFDKLDDQLLAVLNAAVSGVPFMAYDMAGYQYDKHGEPLSEERESRVFARAAAFSVYMPCLQTHGHVRHPYELGEIGRRAYLDCVAARAARAEEMRRLNANAVKTGIAPVRPLVFEFQDDEAVWDMFDEFMYGERTLVAPVLGEADEREVYLPQGTWEDLGSGEIVEAGRGGTRVMRATAPGGVIAFARRR